MSDRAEEIARLITAGHFHLIRDDVTRAEIADAGRSTADVVIQALAGHQTDLEGGGPTATLAADWISPHSFRVRYTLSRPSMGILSIFNRPPADVELARLLTGTRTFGALAGVRPGMPYRVRLWLSEEGTPPYVAAEMHVCTPLEV